MSNSNTVSQGFSTEKCMMKTFGHFGCQSKMNRLGMTRYGKCTKTRQCLEPHPEYCWNGCCQEHCFETAAPCSFNKSLCHR